VTTRAVSAAAGVQPPTIYRIFTDMSGLLDAVALSGFDDSLGRKLAIALTDDPVEDLRSGRDLHVEFGLEHPAHYLLMYGQPLSSGCRPAAAERVSERLHLLVARIAEAGRLKVTVETGVAMISAACSGTTLMLIGTTPGDRDSDLSPRLRESVIASIAAAAHEQARGFAR
jgi:AcrR family transcriptional regulator